MTTTDTPTPSAGVGLCAFCANWSHRKFFLPGKPLGGERDMPEYLCENHEGVGMNHVWEDFDAGRYYLETGRLILGPSGRPHQDPFWQLDPHKDPAWPRASIHLKNEAPR